MSAGAGVEDIAICFGLTPLTVRRRLKLATVSPKLFALYRAGDMNMDQLMALSLAETHGKQEAAWECLPVYNRHANTLRQVILGEGVRDSLVRFVGLEAYEQAGGHVIRDLFSNDEAEAQHIGDPTLMQRLAQEKLAAHGEAMRTGEGSTWVEVSFDHEFELRQRYCPAPTQRREPSAEQAHALGELQRAQDEANSQLEAIYDEDEEADDTADRIGALEGLVQAKQMQIDTIEAQLAYCEPDVAELAGAVLSLAQDGSVVVRRNVVRQADYKAWLATATAAKAGQGGDGSSAAGQDTAPTKGLSAALCQELTAFKTEALQVALLHKPQVALAALAHAMAGVLLYEGVIARHESPTALGVSVRSPNWSLLQIAPATANSPAHKSMQAAVDAWRARLPAEPAALMAFLLEQSVETLQDLLVLCVALTAHALHGTAHAKPAQELAGAAALDMADWWEATGETYLGRVSKAQIAEALTEAGQGEAVGELARLKKGEAVGMAEGLLAGKRWLPELLRVHSA